MVGRATAHIINQRRTPDRDDWFIEAAVSQFWDRYRNSESFDLPMALPDSRIRASWAGMCARRIGYSVAGVEESNPTTAADAWRFNVGSMLHETIQEVIVARFPGSTIEVKVRLSEIGSGHIDVVLTKPDGKRVVVEIKTINGFGFRRMFGRDGEGPRYGGIVQGALNAAALDPPADELMLVVFSLEVMSSVQAQKLGLMSEFKRFAAQWTYTRDEFMAIANEETIRLRRIIELVDQGDLQYVPRIVPDPSLPPHEVINPSKGTIAIKNHEGVRVAVQSTWHCNYCGFQDHCQRDFDREQAAIAEAKAEAVA